MQLDLRCFESAYLGQNRRGYARNVSRAMLSPKQLSQLRDTGWCTFTAPEELLNLHFPEHCHRRIRSEGFSIPCVFRFAPDKGITLEGIRIAGRAKGTVPGKIELSTNCANVLPLSLAPMDTKGFFLTRRIEVATPVNDKQSWTLQRGTTQGNSVHLSKVTFASGTWSRNTPYIDGKLPRNPECNPLSGFPGSRR